MKHEVELFLSDAALVNGTVELGGVVVLDRKQEAIAGSPFVTRVVPGDTLTIKFRAVPTQETLARPRKD